MLKTKLSILPAATDGLLSGAIMILWSPSSWSIWKECPRKYQLRKLERVQTPFADRDPVLANLSVPGLFVDKMLQLWLHRREFSDTGWLRDNSEMIWRLVSSEAKPKWSGTTEEESIRQEATAGLTNAVKMLQELFLEDDELLVQPGFMERITPDFGITGAADLLVVRSDHDSVLIDFKNAHRRERMTRDQLVIYQVGLGRKLGIRIDRAGYLLFNPRLQAWKWFRISRSQEEKYMQRLAEATKGLKAGRFEPNWNHFTCIRFCDVRYSCEIFQRLVGRGKQG
jgi:hypothetical protein